MPIPAGSFEYNLLLLLTIILITGEGILCVYLLSIILKFKKKRGSFEVDFVFGIFILVLCLIISRILYTYVDFVLTEFDNTKFHIPPTSYVWKAAGIMLLSGLTILMFIIDKKVLKFKFKGIFTYIIGAVIVFMLLYPINTLKDLELLSTIQTIGALIGIVLFPVIFIYLGIKTQRIRKIAFTFAFGIIIFAIGETLISRIIMDPLVEVYGFMIKVVIWIISITLRLIGLTMITYSCTKFY